MKIVTFRHGERVAVGGLRDNDTAVVDFTRLPIPQPAEHLEWFDLDRPCLGAAKELLEGDPPAAALLPRDDVELLAPVGRPHKYICIGLNYRDHARESNMELPEAPIVFSKFTSAVVGPNTPVRLPAGSDQSDFEAELAVVIGRRACRVSVADAWHHVLGYTCTNDVSERRYQFADGQWQRGKSCDTFAPLGEFIATRDEIDDPHKLAIRLRLNGETMQDSNTDQLVFGIPQLVSYLSQSSTLEPGDIIATGTPPGVGFARKPPVYLRDGDVMEVEIEGLGILRNPVVATD